MKRTQKVNVYHRLWLVIEALLAITDAVVFLGSLTLFTSNLRQRWVFDWGDKLEEMGK